MRTGRVVSALLLALAVAPDAVAQTAPGGGPPPSGWLVPPVDGAITHPYLDPVGPYAAGHRGLDYAVEKGSLVRAAGPGRVTFAGLVAGIHAVAIDHGDGLTTTYTQLMSTLVEEGDSVDQGHWVGRAGHAHAGAAPGVHFGVKVDGAYVDPRAYLGPVGLAGAVHLAPLPGSKPPVPTSSLREMVDALAYRGSCRPPPVVVDPPPPNANVAVVIGGLGTRSPEGTRRELYETVPLLLGYPRSATYSFSYTGARGPSLHEPYGPVDTYGDLRVAARRLRDLLERIARRAPGRRVDVIAHSQGGLVARLYLETMHETWDARLPVIDHFVTFATPHDGAPLAGVPDGLVEDTVTGKILLRWMSRYAQSGGPVPDPFSTAVAQQVPGSSFLESLAREDVAYGTRVLTLATAGDLLVPADRAGLDNELSRVLAPAGTSGHSRILFASHAVAAAYAFLRDAHPPCSTGWDVWGPRVGAGAGWLESKLPWAYARVESLVGGAALRGTWRLVRKKG